MINLDENNTNSSIKKQFKKDIRYYESCLKQVKEINQKLLPCIESVVSIQDDEQFDSNMKKIYKFFPVANNLLKESENLTKNYEALIKRANSFLTLVNLTTPTSTNKIKSYNVKAEKVANNLNNFDNKSTKFIKDFSKKTKKISSAKKEYQSIYKNLKENTLVISEVDKEVVLPYSIKDVKKLLRTNKEEYSSPEDVVKKVYTVPIKRYKNSAMSRFKEAYKLVRERSNGSKKEALDLAFELTSNYKLHPAIITACKNTHELDVYLSCLEYDELEDFRFFNINYVIPPTQ